MKAKKRIIKKGDLGFDIVIIILLTVLCIMILYPLYYVLVASFTDPRYLADDGI